MQAHPSRRYPTPERKTGPDARDHGVAVPSRRPVRSCPSGLSRSVPVCLTPTGPGSSRTWTKRWTWLGRPGIWGRWAMLSRAGGGWWLFASTAGSGGRRPRRGCARLKRWSGRVNRGRWRMRSAATSPGPQLGPWQLPEQGWGAVSCWVDAEAIGYHRRWMLIGARCVGRFI
jgi:hypothetical protein